MFSRDLRNELEEAAMDDIWIEVPDVNSSNPYTNPTIAIAGGKESPTDKILECKLCHVSFSGMEPYQQHMTGSKHSKKFKKELMKQKYGPKYLEMLKNKEYGNEMHTEVTATLNEDNDDDVIVKYCDICKKICTGEVTYELHIKGKQHQKNVRKMNLIKTLEKNPHVDLNRNKKEMDDSVYDAMSQVKPFAQCDVCNKKFSGPECFQDHLDSASHKKKLSIQALSKTLTGEENSDALQNESGKESSDGSDFFTHYIVCEKNFSGPVPYQQHLISETHKKRLKKNELTKRMNLLSMNDGETDTFDCKECGRSFRIPEEFDQHLKSSAHVKKRIKQHLVHKLQNEYPEMEVQPVSASEMYSLENNILDNCFILICSICNKSFSGPETAMAHFTSPKHSKAKKQQFILQQQRKMKNKKEIF